MAHRRARWTSRKAVAPTVPRVSEPELAAAQTTPRSHLYEIDVLRLLTFACVIAVHTVNYIGGFGVVTDALLTLLHFTRGAFFWLTAFVLTYGQLRRPRPLRRFWPRRFLLVGLPYVVWSGVYVFLNATISDSLGDPIARLVDWGQALLRGDAAEQLYFLLVTMQVYLVIPAFIWAVRRFPEAHLLFLSVAFLVQGAVFWVARYEPATVAWTHGSLTSVFTSYLFFVVGGVVAGAHADAVLRWVRGHRVVLAVALTATAVLALAVYALNRHIGLDLSDASDEMQPVQIVWSTVVTLALLSVGAWWADHRRPGSWDDRTLAWASDRSFGIFLSHPAMITILLALGITAPSNPTALRVPIAYVLVVIGAVVATEAFRWTPLSLPLTGRPMVRRAREARVQPVGENR
ncbi:hypothetical protein DEI82_06945 [Curtobacterium sp. MCBD17_019]|nr:hypothetical protein DEI82_06945 [Curtobacterium sp. MCBD17_019]